MGDQHRYGVGDGDRPYDGNDDSHQTHTAEPLAEHGVNDGEVSLNGYDSEDDDGGCVADTLYKVIQFTHRLKMTRV